MLQTLLIIVLVLVAIRLLFPVLVWIFGLLWCLYVLIALKVADWQLRRKQKK